jgi:hypothetical protein
MRLPTAPQCQLLTNLVIPRSEATRNLLSACATPPPALATCRTFACKLFHAGGDQLGGVPFPPFQVSEGDPHPLGPRQTIEKEGV